MKMRLGLALMSFIFTNANFAQENCATKSHGLSSETELSSIRSIAQHVVPEIKCFSERMFSIQDRTERFMEPSQVTVLQSDGVKLLIYRSPPYGSLIYNLDTGDFFWERDGTRESIVADGENIGVRRLKYPNAPQRGSVFNPMPAGMRRVYTSLEKVGQEALKENISLCRIPEPTERDFRIKMLPEEISQCKALISKVEGFVECQEEGNCSELYNQEFGNLKAGEAPRTMNHEHMYRVNQGLSKRKKTIAGLLAIDYAVSYTVWGTLGFLATRGYKVFKAATAWGLLSNTFSLIWPFAFDFENCRPEEEGGNIDDCRALSPKRMTDKFKAQLLDIIMNPEEFDSIAESDDGGLGRVVCLSMEALYLQEAAKYKSLPSVTCSKHTLEVGNFNYLIQSDGHLAGHRNGRETIHFYFDGDYILENTETGESRSLISSDQKFNYFEVYSQFVGEYRDLSLVKPRIEEALQSPGCKKLPAHRDDFVRSR